MKRKYVEIRSICIMNSVHPANDTRVLKIFSTLAEAGYKVTVLSPSVTVPSETLTEVADRLEFIEIGKPKGNFSPGRGLIALLRTLLSRITVSFQLFKYGWQLKADVYHCNEVDSWFIGLLLKLLLHKRVVFDVHEYYPSYLVALLPFRWLDKFIEVLLVKLFAVSSRLTDGAIFVNQSLAELYQFRCAQAVVRHCVKRQDMQVRAEYLNANLREQYTDRFVLLHIGMMRGIYGTDVFLETLERLRDIPNLLCTILGGISGVADKMAQHRLTQQITEDRLRIKDNVSFEEVVEFGKIADAGLIVVQPSRKSLVFSLGRKFLEYIAFGLPVVASDFPEMRRIVEKYELGLLVNPEDPQDIAQAIRTLVHDPDLRQRMGRNSQLAFEQELNWEMESEKLFGLYSSLGAKRPVR